MSVVKALMTKQAGTEEVVWEQPGVYNIAAHRRRGKQYSGISITLDAATPSCSNQFNPVTTAKRKGGSEPVMEASH